LATSHSANNSALEAKKLLVGSHVRHTLCSMAQKSSLQRAQLPEHRSRLTRGFFRFVQEIGLSLGAAILFLITMALALGAISFICFLIF
jgi:hypothetical protein